MTSDVHRNEPFSIEVTGRTEQVCSRQPGPQGQFWPGRKVAMKKNGSTQLVARKFAHQVGAWLLGGAIVLAGFSRSSFAEGQAGEQCSLAIVTKQAAGLARICDPTT